MSFARAGKKTIGYDPEAVDAFLHTARLAFQGEGEPLTSQAVRTVSFDTVKGGYVIAEVDAAIERLEDAFADRERDEQIAVMGLDAWNVQARAIAQEILNRAARDEGRKFVRTSFLTYGYHTDDVDAFADRVVGFFQHGQPLSRSEVRGVGFRAQLRGYTESQVDAMLDELVRVMLAVK
ncbi:DivIVA domain-containing protein [Microbacteriaceae bacterium MWH-Ta3]|nr:DivIVA domain-containing protein [Microbacteriaceae bacterium MWH-Ta3]